MKAKEIEIHEAGIVNGRVITSYTIFDGEAETDVENHEIHKGELLAFVDRNNLNEYCDNVLTGDYKKHDLETYLADCLDDVLIKYLGGEVIC